MAERTAVEWIHDELTKTWYDAKSSQKLLKKAKQMEKEQIINAWRNGDNDSMYEPKQLDESAKQYYKQTYERETNRKD